MGIIYVVVLTYIKPLEAVDSQIPAHVEWLKKGYSDGNVVHLNMDLGGNTVMRFPQGYLAPW